MSKSSQVDASFINFLVDKVKNVDSPMIISHLREEFMKKNITSLSENVMRTRIRRLRDKIEQFENMDTETKVKMMFAMSAPVGNGFLTDLKKQAIVELDENRRIIKYEEKEGGLKLNGVHNDQKRRYDMETEKKMMQFFADKCQNTSSPMNNKAFAREFISLPGVSLSLNHVVKLFRHMKNQIYLAPEFDKKTKIKMLFASSTTIHESILEELREDADVEVDENRRISKYKANDGSLELTGDHSLSAKTKKGKAESKRRSGVVDDSEDENDQEAKEVENEKDRFTRSGGLSKRRYPNDDSFYSSDDDDGKSSRNVEGSKQAKTKKISMSSMTAEINRKKTEKRKRSKNTYVSESDEETDYDGEEVEKASKPKKRRSIGNTPVVGKIYVPETYEESEEENFEEEDSSEACSLIVESSSVISTVSENTESTRDMNVQNSMESIEFTMDNPVTVPDSLSCESETHQVDCQCSDGNERLIKQEQIGSTPCKEQEVNQGRGEYKPDRSFLNSKKPSIETEESPMADMEVSNVPRGSNEVLFNQIDGKEFLVMLRGLVRTLALPNLGELQSKIENDIEKVGNQTIPTNNIIQTLDTGLLILSINAKLEPPPEEFTSLRDFSLILLSTLSTLSYPSLNTFQLKVKKTFTELAVQDKFVSIKTIRTVLDTMLLLVI